MVKISAIVCTHNNASLVGRAIDSLIRQSVKNEDYEILAVDNGSTDETKSVISGYQEKFPRLSYIYEEKIGLSHARNRGLREAHGEYIAFIDDDATADEEWLSALLKTFTRTRPPVDIIGGKISLYYERTVVPKYIDKDIEIYYGKLDYGESGFFIGTPRLTHYFNGLNFAVRKEIVKQVGPFDATLGRKGRLLMYGEESDFLERAAKNRCRIYYEPAAQVVHSVSEEKLRRPYLIRRYFYQGVSEALKSKNDKSRTFYYKASFTAHKFRDIAYRFIRMFYKRDDKYFTILLKICRDLGGIYCVLTERKR